MPSRIVTTLAAAGLLVSTPAAAQQPVVTLRLVEMSPASPALLHRGQTLYLRISYETNGEMWIRPVYLSGGRRVDAAMTSGSRLLGPGQGETLQWAAFRDAASIDTIRLSASASGRDGFASQDISVDVRWDGQASSEPQTLADWVEPLRAAENEKLRTESQQFGSGGIGAVSIGIAGVLMLIIGGGALLAGVAWPVWGLIRWTGGWRIAAGVPVAAVILYALKDVIDIAKDPTSHNLLPFEFVIAAFLIAPYMLVVSIVRRVKTKGDNG